MRFAKYSSFAIGTFLSLTGGLVFAQSSCGSLLQSYAANPISFADYPVQYPDCFSATTSQISVTSVTQAAAISKALSSRNQQPGPGLRSDLGTTGVAAGNASGLNFWASQNATYTNVSYTGPIGAVRNDSDVANTVVGGDMPISSALTVGVSAAMDRGHGWNPAGTTTTNKGLIVAPYLGYQLSKELALDASAGYGYGKLSNGTNVDADRWFASGNLTYTSWIDKIQLTGRASYLHGVEDSKDAHDPVLGRLANTANKTTVDQVRFGGRASYWMDGVMPYFGLTYVADIRRKTTLPLPVDPVGRRAYVASIGADFLSLSSKITGGVSYEQEFNRTNSKNNVFLANINMRF